MFASFSNQKFLDNHKNQKRILRKIILHEGYKGVWRSTLSDGLLFKIRSWSLLVSYIKFEFLTWKITVYWFNQRIKACFNMHECMKWLRNSNRIFGFLMNAYMNGMLRLCSRIRAAYISAFSNRIKSGCSSMQMYISMDVLLEQHASYVITENTVVLE